MKSAVKKFVAISVVIKNGYQVHVSAGLTLCGLFLMVFVAYHMQPALEFQNIPSFIGPIPDRLSQW